MTNPLAGLPLRYLIGSDDPGTGQDGCVTEVDYDCERPVAKGLSIAYCNLFSEKGRVKAYRPYRSDSDTAAEYDEGEIDPAGQGWQKNLRTQFSRRRAEGFVYIELDNPDAYSSDDVIGAIDLAATYGLCVIAKNAHICDDAQAYLKHPNVYGCIVEKDCGSVEAYETLRHVVGKPDLPIWFVFFGDGRATAGGTATAAHAHYNMGVTYSTDGEYGNSVDLQRPIPPPA